MPYKGVFGHRVGLGAPGELNFPNNQIGPLFMIPLFFLHLKGLKSTLSVGRWGWGVGGTIYGRKEIENTPKKQCFWAFFFTD